MTKTRVYLDQDKTKTMRVWDQVETKNKVEQDWVKTRRYTTFPNVFGWSAPWQNLHTAVINEIQSALRPIPRKNTVDSKRRPLKKWSWEQSWLLQHCQWVKLSLYRLKTFWTLSGSTSAEVQTWKQSWTEVNLKVLGVCVTAITPFHKNVHQNKPRPKRLYIITARWGWQKEMLN